MAEPSFTSPLLMVDAAAAAAAAAAAVLALAVTSAARSVWLSLSAGFAAALVPHPRPQSPFDDDIEIRLSPRHHSASTLARRSMACECLPFCTFV